MSLKIVVVFILVLLLCVENGQFYTYSVNTHQFPALRKICLCSGLAKKCKSSGSSIVRDYSCTKDKFTLSCHGNARISVSKAIYGLKNYTLCPSSYSIYGYATNCTETITATDTIRKRCNGYESCVINLNESFIDHCPCDPFKYIQIKYVCVSYLARNLPFIQTKLDRKLDKTNN